MVEALSLLAWLLAGLVTLFGLVLVTPVRIAVTFEHPPAKTVRVRAWCLGGLAPPISVFDSTKRNQGKPKKAKGGAGSSVRGRSSRGGLTISSVSKLIAGVLRQIRIERLDVDAELGLSDPGDTGNLYGVLAPLLFGLPHRQQFALRIKPRFDGQHFLGRVSARFRVTPMLLLPPGLRFVWRVFGPLR